MIALKVHRHIPSHQLKLPGFRQFLVEDKVKLKDPVLFDLDMIPNYTEDRAK